MLRIRLWMIVCLLTCLGPQPVSAHFLWLLTEPAAAPAKVKVYFSEAAEPDDPTLLARVLKAEAWSVGGGSGGPQPLSLKRGEAALEADLPAPGLPSAVILRHTFGTRSKEGETFLLKYYAKTYPSPLPGTWKAVKDSERLPLEIIPKAEGKTTLLRVAWKGEPAAGDSVTITGAGIEENWEATTDKEGVCRCELPQAAVYSIRVRHIEAATGEYEGQTYQSVRHFSTLALRYAPPRLAPLPHNLPDLPHGTTSFGGAVVDDALYVYGGNYGSAHEYSGEDQSGDLWKLDLKNPNKWEQLPGGPRLQGLAMAEHQGRLYRVGGFSAVNKEGEKQDLRSQPDFARFNPDRQAWDPLPGLPEPRSSHDAAVLGNWNLQGESRGAKWHDTALAINLAADSLKWNTIAAPPMRRRALAVAAWGERLYCIGGMQEQGDPTTSVSVYDPARDSWAEGPALLGGTLDGFGGSAFACRGALYVTTASGSIQRLAGDGRHWEFLGQLAHPRFFHRLLPWRNESLVVVGGGSMTTGKIPQLELLPIGELESAAK